ncbi:MAG: MarR family winged helix-turn-helix transcriptional regulator [Bacteroidota bacterium]
MSELAEEAARQVLDTIPLVMRTIRAEFRDQRSNDLSVPQFRALAYINSNDGSSLSSLANHIGLTLPSMSKLVDGLVSRGLVARDEYLEDRRRICLRITLQGKSELETVHDHTEAFLSDKMSGLTPEDLAKITQSLQILKDLFVSID